MPIESTFSSIIGAIYRSAPAVLITPRSADAQPKELNAMASIAIPLHSQKCPGLFATIDESDFDLVSAYKWHPMVPKNPDYSTYAFSQTKRSTIYLHRLITAAKTGDYVDHIDHDGLNNLRSNLRVCTQSQNMQNRNSHGGNTTGFMGVYFHKKTNKYQAQLQKNGRKISAGLYPTPEEAARARDQAALKHFGVYAYLNFPEEAA